MDLRDFIFKRLPQYYKENDTYKDTAGKGILERFLGTLGVELQEELIVKLEKLIDELDPLTAVNQFLSQIAYQLGNPTDILGDEASYRIRLTQALTLYKVKGTLKGYELLFGLLGYRIELDVIFPDSALYDTGLLYDADSDEFPITYDLDTCSVGCVKYSIDYYPITGRANGPLTSDQMELLVYVIQKDLQPIDATLTSINYEGEPALGSFNYGFNFNFD